MEIILDYELSDIIKAVALTVLCVLALWETGKKIVEILSEYLRYDEEGNKRVYVPAVISIIDGKIIGFDDESSYDTLGFEHPEDYWSEERVNNLKLRLTEMISAVVDNKCSECNK